MTGTLFFGQVGKEKEANGKEHLENSENADGKAAAGNQAVALRGNEISSVIKTVNAPLNSSYVRRPPSNKLNNPLHPYPRLMAQLLNIFGSCVLFDR